MTILSKLQSTFFVKSARRHISAALVCSFAAFALAFSIAPVSGWAEPETQTSVTETSTEVSTAGSSIITVPAVREYRPSSASSPLSATVTYDSAFESGKTTRFTYNISGNTKPVKYLLYSFKMETDEGWTSLIDSTRGEYFDWSDKNYFEEAIYSAGKYQLTFAAGEYTPLENGHFLVPSYVRFVLEFSVDETGSIKSLDTTIAEIAQQCKAECAAQGDTSQYAYALWLNDWLVDNTEFDNSLVYCSAEAVLNRHKGTCEGYHAAYTKLCNAVGIETRRVDSSGDNHVWTGVNLDGHWYNTDVTWNDSGSTGTTGIDGQHLYFALPSSIMQLVHPKWDGSYVAGNDTRERFDATSYSANYLIKTNEIDGFCSPYRAESGTYSIKAQLAKYKTEFTLPLVNDWPQDNYKTVIYSLVAHQLEQENWGSGIKVAAAYSNGALSFTATYDGSTPAQSLANAIVSNIEDKPYTSGAITQNPKVYLDGKLLTEKKDYVISYADNVAVTADKSNTYAKVIITGRGSYFGSIVKVFDITKADLRKVTIDRIGANGLGLEYTGSALTPRLTVRTGTGVLSVDDYNVEYKNNTNVGEATITITPKGNNCTGSKTETFRIYAKQIPKPSLSTTDVYYDGTAQKPVVVKDGSRTLKEGTDYSIEYKNNVNLGTATATVTGKGNYKGTSSIDFAIKEKPNSSSSGGSTTGGNANSSGGSATNGGASTPPAATSPSGNNSGVTPSKPTSVTTQSKPKAPSVSGTWKKSHGKWWFAYDDKTKAIQKKQWPVNEWIVIDGKRYHFDGAGYMHTSWQCFSGKWYYFASDGAMRTGWQKTGGKWYYLHTDGIMQTGKKIINGKTYFLNTSSGAMKTGWNKEGAGWYYYAGSGAMAKGWATTGGKWYYLDPSNGLMRTGFYKVGNIWYYSNGSGAMLTGWQKIGGKYYYFNRSGAMQHSKWIGNYYVGSDGVMATNTWIGKYHVNGSGKWDRTR